MIRLLNSLLNMHAKDFNAALVHKKRQKYTRNSTFPIVILQITLNIQLQGYLSKAVKLQLEYNWHVLSFRKKYVSSKNNFRNCLMQVTTPKATWNTITIKTLPNSTQMCLAGCSPREVTRQSQLIQSKSLQNLDLSSATTK